MIRKLFWLYLIAVLVIFNGYADAATLTAGNVPKVSTGGSTPKLADSPISVSGNNVGIGSVNPTQALDVVGTIKASSDVSVNSVSVCLANGVNCTRGIIGNVSSIPSTSTFIKNFATATDANADSSSGSGTATVTSARSASAPATYFTIAGVLTTTTTANTPRLTKGYIDETGFHSRAGLLIENAMTNQATYSYTFSNAAWVASNITVGDNVYGSPDGTANADRLTATASNATLTQTYTTGSATYTASVFLKRVTGSGPVYISANNGSNSTECVVDTLKWVRCSDTRTGANPTVQIILSTNGDVVGAYGAQLEASPYATSFIPNGTTANTRPAETVKYATSSNLTSASQTVFIKFTPEWNESQPTNSVQFWGTDTKNQRIILDSSVDSILWNPNATDSALSSAGQLDSIDRFKSVIITGSFDSTVPTASVYTNGFLEVTDTDSITAPAYGTNLWLGSSTTSTNQANSIIEEVRVYSGSLTQGQVYAVNQAMGISPKINILPIGDSITNGGASPNDWSYRKDLQRSLGDEYLFVGNKNTPPYDPDSKYSTKHAGVSGEETTAILARVPANLSNYFISGAYRNGSAVLIHAGTNDITNNPQSDFALSITAAITNIKSMIDLIDAVDPSINVFVAKLIPRYDSEANLNYSQIFNKELESTRLNWTKKNVYIVDMQTAFRDNPYWITDYMFDNKHPKQAGYEVMARVWDNAIKFKGSLGLLNSTSLVFSATSSMIKNSSTTSASNLAIVGGSSPSSYLEHRTTMANGSGDYIKFTGGINGATEIARFNGSGNVGIGTTIPASPLTIKGSALMQKVSVANTDCSTTCGVMACYFGEDTGVLGTLLDCSDATADVCFCSK